jgi:hypothetical protein
VRHLLGKASHARGSGVALADGYWAGPCMHGPEISRMRLI